MAKYYYSPDGVDDKVVPPLTVCDEIVFTARNIDEDFLKIGDGGYIWVDPDNHIYTLGINLMVSINGSARLGANNHPIPDNSSKNVISLKKSGNALFTEQLYFFTANNGYFAKGHYWDIKLLLDGVIQAHYDLTQGHFNDVSGNGRHPEVFGGTWVVDPDAPIDPVDTTPPKVTIVSTSRTKISDEPGMNQSIITVTFDKDVTEYIARLNGVDHTTGEIVHEGGALSAGQEGQVIIDWDELTTEGANRINIYGKNASGAWTPYGA